jgi:hypothetical protein
MKTIFAVLASASLLAVLLALSPTVATARGGGGFHGAGGFHGGFHDGGFRGAGFHDGGVRNAGFRGDGFRDHGIHDGGFHGRGFADRGFRGGFFDDDFLFDDTLLGLAFADAGFYDDPGFYGAYTYGPPYPASGAPSAYDDGGDGAPYQSRWDQAQPGKTCGSWVWNADQYKYNWTSC